MREILYGMSSEEPDPAVYLIGGCLVEPNQPSHRCMTCGWERVKNAAKSTKWELEHKKSQLARSD